MIARMMQSETLETFISTAHWIKKKILWHLCYPIQSIHTELLMYVERTQKSRLMIFSICETIIKKSLMSTNFNIL